MIADATKVAWLAGLYEGEGSLVIYRRGERRLSLYLSITTTDEDVARRAGEVAGCGRIYGPYKPEGTRKLRWRWAVTRRADAVAVAKAIRPHLLTRRTVKVDEALAAVAAHVRYCRRGLHAVPDGGPCDPCRVAARERKTDRQRERRLAA